jgi:hypothetical protein
MVGVTFKRKPSYIEAVLWDGTPAAIELIAELSGQQEHVVDGEKITVGDWCANAGDWFVRDKERGFRAISDRILNQMYERC